MKSWVDTKTTWILIREEGGRENPLSNLAGRCDMVAPPPPLTVAREGPRAAESMFLFAL